MTAMDASIETRLQRLEDERDVLRPLYQYGHTLDYGPEDAFLDCFTETAVWTQAGRFARPETTRRFEGRGGLIKLFRHHTHAPEIYHKHLLVEPRITLHGDEASVESYYVRIDEHPEGAYIRAFGRYRDRVVRCPDGHWRIQQRLTETEGRNRKDFPPAPWTDLPLTVR
jgi:hypothetical protein